MAPKPTPKLKGKADAKATPGSKPVYDADVEATSSKAPDNKAQVISRVSLVGLPTQSSDAEDAIIQLLNIKYETLTQIFAYYCKMSECETVEVATSLKLGAHVPPFAQSTQPAVRAAPKNSPLTHVACCCD